MLFGTRREARPRIPDYDAKSQSAIIWDIDSRNPLLEVFAKDLGQDKVGRVGYSRDGTMLAVDCYPATIVCDATTGKPIRRMEVNEVEPEFIRTPQDLVFCPNGKLLASDCTVWEVGSGKIVLSRADMQPLAFTPDGRKMLFATQIRSPLTGGIYIHGHRTHLVDVATWRDTIDLGEFSSYSFSPDGKRIALQDQRTASTTVSRFVLSIRSTEKCSAACPRLQLGQAVMVFEAISLGHPMASILSLSNLC